MGIAAAILLALLGGSLVYCLLVIVAARRFSGVVPAATDAATPISVLKPLSGLDEGLEENLRSFFVQEYAHFEILFAVRDAADPAVKVVEKLMSEFRSGPAVRLLVTGPPAGPNAKVFSLKRMVQEARNDLLVMSDSDVRVTPEMLRRLAGEFQNERIGLVTCPYRAVPGDSFWSRLEAVGMNTEFLAGVLVARMLEGMKFALGPTIAVRREVLERMGGLDRFKDYLAEDFVMGNFAAKLGYGVLLSSYVIEHRIGAQALVVNLRHRLRWARSTRRSRPFGYAGQVFTNPLPLALMLEIFWPSAWPALLLAVALRVAAAWAVAGPVLRNPGLGGDWWLLPIQDLVSFAVWIAGFAGNTIQWRGQKYYLSPDGKFELVT